ncbi:MAG: hypothetical protein ACOYMF_10430 [Bacteroidales bacterium]
MKTLFRILLLLLMLIAAASLNAQNPNSFLDKAYGLDPFLHNGRLYAYFMPTGTEGTPFLHAPAFEIGSVTLRGVTYNDIALNYDVFNRQLVFKYKTKLGAENLITIDDAWLESFTLGNARFELLALQDTLKQIYQVMGDGPCRIIYSWSKEKLLDQNSAKEYYSFPKAKRESYILNGEKLLRYKKNRSFVMCFDRADQPLLKKYIHQSRIKLKKAPDQVIIDLVNYCNSLASK